MNLRTKLNKEANRSHSSSSSESGESKRGRKKDGNYQSPDEKNLAKRKQRYEERSSSEESKTSKNAGKVLAEKKRDSKAAQKLQTGAARNKSTKNIAGLIKTLTRDIEEGEEFTKRKKDMLSPSQPLHNILFEGYNEFMGQGELEKLKKQQITEAHIDEAHKMKFIIKPAKLKELGIDKTHDEVILTPNDFRVLLLKCKEDEFLKVPFYEF